MPTVPLLQDNRIKEQSIDSPRVSTDTPEGLFGGGSSAQAVSKAGLGLAKRIDDIRREEANKADQIAILDADQKLAQLETDLLYNSQTGAVNKKGKDAFAVPDDVSTRYKDGVSEIEKGLNGDFQKRSFQDLSVKRGLFIDRTVQKHVSTQSRAYDEEVTTSYIANERNAAMENFDNEDRIKLSVDRQRGAILSHGDRNGLSSETMDLRTADMESKTYSDIITKVLNGGADARGKEYYAKYKDKIIGDDKVRIEKILQQSVLMGDGQRSADKIMAKTDNSTDALAAARSIQDPKLRDETVSRVKQRLAEEKVIKRDNEESNYQVAFGAIENQKSMDAIPKDVLDTLSETTKRNLKDHLAKLLSGKPAETDFDTYYNLEQMAGSPATKDKFLQLNLMSLRHRLSDVDFKKFSSMQNGVRKGETKELDGIETKTSIVSNSLAQAGVKLGKGANADDVKKSNQFRRAVDKLVVERKDATGKKVTNEDLRQITDNLMLEVITGKSFIFFDQKKRFFELAPGDTPMVRFKDIPDNERSSIESSLRRRGIPTTEENVTKIYVQKLNQFDTRRGEGG